MAITNFIPTIWSETLYTQLDKQYIAVANSNREFEGDIKEKGSVVRICGVGEVTVSDYTKNTDMSTPQSLSDTVKELAVDQAKYFNFQIDDIDKAQCTPKLMDAAMKVAANALANEADAHIFGLYADAGNTVKVESATEENIIDALIKARTKLYENNVSDANDVVIEVSPAVAELILKAKVNLATDNTASLENGCIGSIGGCKIFVSNNIIADSESVEGVTFYKCMARTRRAIAFAEQLSEINAYRPEKRFADAVKGLYLYGAKVVYSGELVLLDIGVAN
ncbi:MAG: P22 coat protein - protein 5 domain protein [Clostridia bacterium]|nr:P22 coat protein - protein 5 domain protein [Clostridia bacterium]